MRGCRDGFLGRKNNLWFEEELRTVEILREQLFRKEIWVCEVTSDFTFQRKLSFCF